jgi:hypothetical protein
VAGAGVQHSPADQVEAQLVQRLKVLVLSNRRSSTLQQYKSYWTRFVKWCAQRHPPRPALPASHVTVALYLVSLFEDCVARDLTYSAIKSASAAIFCMHDLALLDDRPTQHALCTLVRDSALLLLGLRVTNRKEPFTAAMMVGMVLCYPDLWDKPPLLTIVTMLVLCFAAGLRFDDAVKLRVRHLTFYPDHFTVFLPWRKNDVYRVGHMVPVARGQTAADPYRLVTALLNAAPDGAEKPIFRGFEGAQAERRHYNVPMKAEALTYAQAHYHGLTPLSQVLGLSQEDTAELYDLHSGRSGCATTAVGADIDDRDLLCCQMGWRDQRCANKYIKLAHGYRLQVSSSLGL